MSDPSTPIRVRFAPSPTGFLHVGGARTALFNYLLARSRGGQFLLRIEDTDLERSTPEMVDAILNGLTWLGLAWDEEPVYQSKNRSAHVAAANQLLEQGHAYRCFCSKEELDSKRRKAEEEGRAYRYDGTCRGLSPDEIENNLEANKPFVVRFSVPQEGITRFKDMVRKNVAVQNTEIDDFVILRSDGSPVYQLAVVVDDMTMQVTHIIRGEDHISNTPKQILLYLALGAKPPKFGHVPLILGSDGKRLSKRHGATSVLAFEEQGILPEAMFNFLALLGWSAKDNREFYQPEEIIKRFEPAGFNKTPAVFDQDKLQWLNSQHIKALSASELLQRVQPVFARHDLEEAFTAAGETVNLNALTLLQEKMRTLEEFATFGQYFWVDPENYSQEAVERYFQNADEARKTLSAVERVLTSCDPFDADRIEVVMRDLADEMGVKAATLIHPVRVALTGFHVSPSLFDMMAILGQETCLRRLQNAVAYLKS
ncbi:MAG: glutamate--tRNA ligase [Lentisphaeria bacterium]|nr:glutamate--tRNA ligase [Candidatus Neomarinimicrobiota bacterium]MCF7841209.1 glutamate--tRNA ligase [Lentisphaeria bacterium]